MITVFFYARLWRRAEVLTDVELVELRYHGRPAAALRGFRALYVALLINPIIIGWVTGAMLKVLRHTVLYDAMAPVAEGAEGVAAAAGASDWAIIVICLAVVGVYSTLSGLWGVAITDFVQFFLAMIGCIILAVLAVRYVGGIDELQAKVTESFGADAFRFIPEFGGDNEWMPLDIFMIILLIQWWATWYPGAEPGGGGYIVQRMSSCRDERHSLLATLWYQVAHYCVRPWPWLMVAFVAMAVYPDLEDRESGFPIIMREVAPAGLCGLLIVTFFAAFMSTISTQMNWGASYLVSDFYRRFINPEADQKRLTGASRIASVITLVLGGVAAWLMRNQDIGVAWKMMMALGAGTGAVFMLRWFWWRINAWAEISAMVASLVYYVGIQVYLWRSTPDGAEPQLKDEHVIAIVAGLTIVTWLIVMFATAPDKEEHLVKFFRKVRPGGPGWKPIARLAPDVKQDDNLRVSLLATVLSVGLVYLTLPGVGLLIFGRYGEAAACLGGAALCAAAVYALLRRVGWDRFT